MRLPALLALLAAGPALAAGGHGKEPPPEAVGGEPVRVPGFVVPSYHALPPTVVAAMRQRLLEKAGLVTEPKASAEDAATADHGSGL